MSEFRKHCELYFGTKDFYEILKIKKGASDKEIKKAYHKLSLLCHPDRVEDDKKEEATEKFKVLGKIHSILSDKNKRSVYDDTGDFDEESDSLFNWMDYWRSLFKKITLDDIRKHEQEYKNSETELRDLKKAYLNGKGDIDFIYETVPFVNCDDEPRIVSIIKKWISNEEVPEYKIFTEEPKKKTEKRRKKWAKEREEAETIDVNELAKAIQKNNDRRLEKMNDFFTNLEAKYGGDKGKKKRKSIKNNTNDTPPAKRTRSRKLIN